MAINEVFPNPTVKQVIFQIRYPNLFFLESKMGDIQIRIMKHFPQSQLIIRRQLLLAEIRPNVQPSDMADDAVTESAKKIWKFSSEKGVELHILQDSLDITSNTHKTYNNPRGEPRFRDAIQSVLEPFFEVTNLPIIQRVGLRYIDECPVPKKETNVFREYYNSCFPLDRFSIEDATEMHFRTSVRRGEYFIRYMETLQENDGQTKLILDFDGYALDVDPSKCLETTDKLHEIISEEFERSIREPVYEFMRKKEGAEE